MTPEQKKNLQIFLSRVTLQGSEVGAFNELIAALFNEKEEEKEAPKAD